MKLKSLRKNNLNWYLLKKIDNIYSIVCASPLTYVQSLWKIIPTFFFLFVTYFSNVHHSKFYMHYRRNIALFSTNSLIYLDFVLMTHASGIIYANYVKEHLDFFLFTSYLMLVYEYAIAFPHFCFFFFQNKMFLHWVKVPGWGKLHFTDNLMSTWLTYTSPDNEDFSQKHQT